MFWKEDGASVSLDTEAVAQNALENLMRLDGGATLRAASALLRTEGYTVEDPEGNQ